MGGKDAIIVDSSADLAEAAGAIVNSAFGFQSQKCSACSRAIVLEDVYDEVVAPAPGKTRGIFCLNMKNMALPNKWFNGIGLANLPQHKVSVLHHLWQKVTEAYYEPYTLLVRTVYEKANAVAKNYYGVTLLPFYSFITLAAWGPRAPSTMSN